MTTTPVTSSTGQPSWRALFVVIGAAFVIALFGSTGATVAEWILGVAIAVGILALTAQYGGSLSWLLPNSSSG
jgi:hypothetical protein